jgi:simple sugar transport system ATP-binding protein
MLNIRKEFSGLVANDDVTLQLKKGEIHALLGENGAGKSTLMSVLFGLYKPEKGVIKKDGEIIKIDGPKDANKYRIGMVHQHFKLVEVFSVIDNIILGNETTKFGFVKRKEARTKIKKLSEEYGLHVDLDAKIEDISVGMQQRVEILKMLYRDNDILIFDEPTAVLTPQEIEDLLKIMKNLANNGKSILFITHKINEILSIADRCTVLRKGKYIGTVDVKTTNKDELSEMISWVFIIPETEEIVDVILSIKVEGIIRAELSLFDFGESDIMINHPNEAAKLLVYIYNNCNKAMISKHQIREIANEIISNNVSGDLRERLEEMLA